MVSCHCGEALKGTFSTALQAYRSIPDVGCVTRHCELVAARDEAFMRLLRCRCCGVHWVEAWHFSGQMEVRYLYPAPAGGDVPGWFATQARRLPAR